VLLGIPGSGHNIVMEILLSTCKLIKRYFLKSEQNTKNRQISPKSTSGSKASKYMDVCVYLQDILIYITMYALGISCVPGGVRWECH